MRFPIQSGAGNKFLAGLSNDDAAYLTSASRIVSPSVGQVLSSRTERTGDVWFPHSGIVALIATDSEGRSVQTGVIGAEGCIGLEAVYEPGSVLPDAVVQIGAPMTVIQGSLLRALLAARPAIHATLAEVLHSLSVESSRTLACNQLHSLMARCCRWLLTIQDRIGSAELPLTQDSLATLLGNGRPRITRLLARCESLGLVRRRRGRIMVIDRNGLLTQACECYRILKDTKRNSVLA